LKTVARSKQWELYGGTIGGHEGKKRHKPLNGRLVVEHAVLPCPSRQECISAFEVDRKQVDIEDGNTVDLIRVEAHPGGKAGVLVCACGVVGLPRLQEGDTNPAPIWMSIAGCTVDGGDFLEGWLGHEALLPGSSRPQVGLSSPEAVPRAVSGVCLPLKNPP